MKYFHWVKWHHIAALAAIAVAIWLLGVRPIVGVADNGDFLRVTGTVGLTDAVPNESFEDRYFGYFHSHYRYGAILPGGYVSTQFFPTLLAELIGLPWPGRLFDIRLLGLVYTALLAAALYLFVKYNRMRTWWANVLMVALLVFVFADGAYVAYFNSFFGEPTTYVFLLLTVALGVMTSRIEEPPRRLAALFFAAAILCAGSKTQTAPVGLVFALLGLRLWAMDGWRPWRLTVRRWTIALLIVSAVLFVVSPPSIDRINQYQAVFYGILKDSPNPEQDLRDLGFDPALAVNAGTDAFTPNVAIPQNDPRLDGFYRDVSFGKVIGFYITHPKRFWDKLEAASDSVWTARPYYLGSYEKREGKPRGAVSTAFSVWSEWKKEHHPHGFGWILLGYVLYGLGLAFEYSRARTHQERLIPDMFAAVALTGAMSLVIPFIGSGEADFSKHLFLAGVCFDIMLVSSVVWLLRLAAGGREA